MIPVVLDIKELALSLDNSQRLELSSFLVASLFDYTSMYLDDGSDLQYRRFLSLCNKFEHVSRLLDSIDPSFFELS